MQQAGARIGTTATLFVSAISSFKQHKWLFVVHGRLFDKPALLGTASWRICVLLQAKLDIEERKLELKKAKEVKEQNEQYEVRSHVFVKPPCCSGPGW